MLFSLKEYHHDGSFCIFSGVEPYLVNHLMYLAVSDYPMNAAYCISMITNVVERKWKIL
uniref:Nucleolar essential protein n=1 Tax=Solanum tuberosum TaxID=4113 RepID=M1CT15_SOLTU